MTQLAFDFDAAEELLHDPCQVCMKVEATRTVPHDDSGICEDCWEDRRTDYYERFVDRD